MNAHFSLSFCERTGKRNYCMANKFKVGDKVYDFNFGWGEVIEIKESISFPIVVQFGDSDDRRWYKINYTDYGVCESDYIGIAACRLSHTNYGFSGFTSERLNLNYGDFVYAWNEPSEVFYGVYQYMDISSRYTCRVYKVGEQNFANVSKEIPKHLSGNVHYGLIISNADILKHKKYGWNWNPDNRSILLTVGDLKSADLLKRKYLLGGHREAEYVYISRYLESYDLVIKKMKLTLDQISF
jgi:hypothetical protein